MRNRLFFVALFVGASLVGCKPKEEQVNTPVPIQSSQKGKYQGQDLNPNMPEAARKALTHS